ncbi:P-loop NTPase fold protein [Salinivibrio sp. VYel1]|uniref:KAP family P-loop NTPase fold protein n=1 Tax=Salinivibrio sp. VYel1 TaxID=2490490 RepID=UPI00128D6D54|nr:P-loop NTPase fold protein [Salinivibrio sp. VYel1]MPX91382.1 NTPase [Salinivibrio sp. VYel1]
MPEQTLSFNWSSPTTSEKLPPDTLDRARYASFLHNYLVDVAKSGGYVLNLNASWGAGKTFFIKRWVDSIEDTHPVVYIDAWKQDYSDDPMLTVVSSLINAFEGQLPAGNQSINNIAQKSAKFMKTAAPILTRALFKKATGIDPDAFSNTEDTSEILHSDHIDDVDFSEVVSDSAAKLAKLLVNEHNEKLLSIQHLREEVKKLVEAVVAHRDNIKSPAFVFIDELDRCRPSYAVEMLEVVKHFFELNKIVFIIATNTEQLQHTVKAVYGEDFDAQTYLGRFFRRRYSLSEPSTLNFIETMIGSSVTIQTHWSEHIPSITKPRHLARIIFEVADYYKLSLREIEQLSDKLLACLYHADKSFNPSLLLILFVIRDKNYTLYKHWIEAKSEEDFLPNGTEESDLCEGEFVYYFAPEDEKLYPGGSNNGRGTIKHHLYSILSKLNKFTEPLSYQPIFPYPMDYPDSSIYRIHEHANYFLEQGLFNLTATKKDYRDWVELSVSFDR